MISRAVLVHYRTDEAKQLRRLHGDRGGVSFKTNSTAPIRIHGAIRLVQLLKITFCVSPFFKIEQL